MTVRRAAVALVAVAVLIAWPVLAATTNLYLPLVTNALVPTFTPAPPLTPTATGKPATITPTVKPGASATPTNAPTATTLPGATVTPTVKPGASATPTNAPTATTLPSATVTPTAGATSTPTPLPPSLNACQQDPNANSAPNYPVKIIAIDKSAETVTLQNVSGSTIDLTSWTMCSITGNQTHPIFGTLAPNTTATFQGPAGNIWNNSQRDDGALYNPNGSLVSYLGCATTRTGDICSQ